MSKAQFAKEVDLCAAFLATVPPDWTAYPETGGFDILLSRLDGLQIGIEAKLKLNAEVLGQAVERSRWNVLAPGPDFRAVLVPGDAPATLCGLAYLLRVTVIRFHGEQGTASHRIWGRPFSPDLPRSAAGWEVDRDWHEMLPATRVKLPDYVPDVRAGDAAPVQLSEWKIKALKLAVVMARRGFLSRADFKVLGINMSRWTQGRWIVPGGDGWVRGEAWPRFDEVHAKVFAAIEADYDVWGAALPRVLPFAAGAPAEGAG